MYSLGILIEQHLQCTQFCALITNSGFPSLPSAYSYTLYTQQSLVKIPLMIFFNDSMFVTYRAGQNRCSGPSYFSYREESSEASSGLMRKWAG